MSIQRSLAISTATRMALAILHFANVVVISRLLIPSEIGIFSVAISLIGIAQVLRDFGVGNYLIQAKEISQGTIRAAFTVMLVFSWSLGAIIFFAKDIAANFYNQVGISHVMAVLALSFFMIPFAAPVQSLLRRQMQFGRIAIVQLSSALVQTGVTVSLAMLGHGYMSMAWGAVAGMLSNVIVLSIMRPRDALPIPTSNGLRAVLTFGYKHSGNALVNEVGERTPDLIFGRTLGFEAVAYFSRAAGLIQMSIGQINTVLYGVLLPAFANKIRSGHGIQSTYCRSVEYLVVVAGPLLAFLAIMAEPVIALVFGDQWRSSAPLATMLCLASILALPYALAGTVLVASGNVGSLLRVQLLIHGLRAAVMLTSLYFDLNLVVLLLGALTLLSNHKYSGVLRQKIDLNSDQLWNATRTGYLITGWSAAGPLSVQHFFDRGVLSLSPTLELFLALLSSAILWLASVLVMKHPIETDLIKIKKRFVK